MEIAFVSGLVALYSIGIGLFMTGFWAYLFVARRVEGHQNPVELAYHVAAELLTAALLVASGIGLLSEADWAMALSFLALGMLLYTVIASPGFYAARRERAMVTMFIVLVILTILAIIALLLTA